MLVNFRVATHLTLVVLLTVVEASALEQEPVRSVSRIPETDSRGPAGQRQTWDEMLSFLKTTAELMRLNISQIKSISGTYDLINIKTIEYEKHPAIWQTEGVAEFEYDLINDLGFSIIDESPSSRVIDAATNRPLTSSLAGDRWVSVVTPEHWLSIAQFTFIGQIPGYPEVKCLDLNKGGRVAYRRERRIAKHGTLFGTIIDPREFLGQAKKTFDKIFDKYFEDLSSPGFRKHNESRFWLEKASSNGELVRLVHVYPRRPPDPSSHRQPTKNVFLFDISSGHNLVSWEIHESDHLDEQMTWTYSKTDGVYFPNRFAITRFDRKGNSIITARVFVMRNLAVNRPLSGTGFEISRLGLRYGDRLEDQILKKLSVFDGKGLVAAEQFVCSTPPGGTGRPSSKFGRVTILLFGQLLIACVLAVVWIRRSKKLGKTPQSPG